MNLQGNTILITGGGSGIGLKLAQEFAKLDNEVVIAGRSAPKLAAAAKLGFKTMKLDMSSAASIETFAQQAIQEFTKLNVVIHNAGIMKNENLLQFERAQVEDETVATNLLGPMRLTNALLPHFLRQPFGTIMTVTSGLAYLPLAMTPTYSATKAAIHSYTQSLRYQLQDTKIDVIELVPPYVQTELMGQRQANDPHAMPLDEFIAEVMGILSAQPSVKEILVKRVHPLRFSADGGAEKYDSFFKQFNDQMRAARASEF